MRKYRDLISKLETLFRNEVNDPNPNRGTDTTDTDLTPTNDIFTLTNKGLKNVIKVTDSNTGTEYYEFIDFNKDLDDPTDDTDYPTLIWKSTAPSSIDATYHHGKTWIYPGWPHKNVTSPRISINFISETERAWSLGEWTNGANKLHFPSVLAETNIWVKKADSWTISGEYYSGGKLCDYLADELLDAVMNNRDLLKKWGIVDMRIQMSRNLEFREEDLFHRKLIDWDIDYQKVY